MENSFSVNVCFFFGVGFFFGFNILCKIQKHLRHYVLFVSISFPFRCFSLSYYFQNWILKPKCIRILKFNYKIKHLSKQDHQAKYTRTARSNQPTTQPPQSNRTRNWRRGNPTCSNCQNVYRFRSYFDQLYCVESALWP